jgi:hypothetical protein
LKRRSRVAFAQDLPQRAESGSRTHEPGHAVSHQVVDDLLHELEHSLQANRKTSTGTSHPTGTWLMATLAALGS